MAQTARGCSSLQIGRGLASLRASVITAQPRGMFSRLHGESLGGESLPLDCIVHAFLTANPKPPPTPKAGEPFGGPPYSDTEQDHSIE